MHHLNQAHNLHLQRNQVASFACHSAVLICVKTGRVWITAAGMLDDHWLAAGDSMLLPASSHMVVQAEDRFTSLDLLPHVAEIGEPQSGPWLTLLQLIPQFLRRPLSMPSA